MRIAPSVLSLVLSFSLAVSPDPALSAAGDLDPTFGVGGRVISEFLHIGGTAAAVLLQPDGKIVVGGEGPRPGGRDFTLARYHPDGTPDASFGSGGVVKTAFPDRNAGVDALALLPDGRIVAVGTLFSNSSVFEADFALARYHPDGSLDASFGVGGRVVSDFGGIEIVGGGALLPDGRIVVAGWRTASAFADFAIALYESDGNLDTGFGSGGLVLTDFFGRDDVAQDVAVQPDGKIVALGAAFPGDPTRIALARYELDGSLDESFGGDGRVTSDSLALSAHGVALALQPDGRIVVAGTAAFAGFDFIVARFLADGSPDTGFGTSGWTVTDFFGQHDEARAVALQPDGGIVLAGGAQTGGDFPSADFALARYDADGLLDASFGTAGRVTTDFFELADLAYAAALQPDGLVVVAGLATDSNQVQQFALARYIGAVNTPPVLTGAAVSRPMLWPPNHRMSDVTVSYQVTDEEDPNPSCVLGVTSDEPVNGTGDGDTAPDWEVVDAHQVRLRAERSGRGDGRIYAIAITCTDSAGASASETVTVGVPLSRGRK